MIRRVIIFKDFAAVKIDTMVCWIMTPCSLVGRQVDTNTHNAYIFGIAVTQVANWYSYITHHFPKLVYFFILNDETVYFSSTQL
jgi:hypothetical protein